MSSSSVQAQATYDNGAPDTKGNFGMTRNAVADNFLISSSVSFNSIRFFAYEESLNLADHYSGTLSWWVYADAPDSRGDFKPGATLLSGVTSQVRITNTGLIAQKQSFRQIGQYDFSTGTQSLAAGSYWLRIAEGEPSSSFNDQSDLFWVTTTVPLDAPPRQDKGVASSGMVFNPTPESYGQTGSEFAFQFRMEGITASPETSIVAPEPSALALVALAFPFTAAAICRRKSVRTAAVPAADADCRRCCLFE